MNSALRALKLSPRRRGVEYTRNRPLTLMGDPFTNPVAANWRVWPVTQRQGRREKPVVSNLEDPFTQKTKRTMGCPLCWVLGNLQEKD